MEKCAVDVDMDVAVFDGTTCDPKLQGRKTELAGHHPASVLPRTAPPSLHDVERITTM